MPVRNEISRSALVPPVPPLLSPVRAPPLPSPLEEANQPRVPPAPRLQERPENELLTFRLQEQDVLTSYGWVSESAGVARIPIERAIEILAERGLPLTAAAPAPAPPAAAEEGEQQP